MARKDILLFARGMVKVMRQRKKMQLLMIFAAMFCIFLVGCSGEKNQGNEKKETEKIKVVSTIFVGYDFAKQLVGDDGEVTMLLPPASESHSYEPTPQDIINIQNCDLFLYVGGESDSWIDDVLKNIDTTKVKTVKMIDCVHLLEEETVEGMEAEEHDHEDGENEEEYDEHVWTSPKNAIAIVERIQDALSQVDPGNKSKYEEREKTYVKKLQDLDQSFRQVVENGKRKTIVVADRFPLRYFVEEYGLDYFAAFPGCSEDTEPSAATIVFLIDKIKEEKIPVVFHMELSNEKMADTICDSTGAKKYLFHACHNVSKKDFEAGVTYLSLMEKNVESLKLALQ